MPDFIAPEIKLGTHAGWDLFYLHANRKFVGRKGRRERESNYLDGLIQQLDRDNAAEMRKKVRKKKVEFILWDDEKQTEQLVELTSYSSRGLGVRPAGGEVFYLDLNPYSKYPGRPSHSFATIAKDTDTGRLHRAVEMLRRAQEEYRQAREESVEDVTVNKVSGSSSVDYFTEEDRLRDVLSYCDSLSTSKSKAE